MLIPLVFAAAFLAVVAVTVWRWRGAGRWYR